MKIQVALMAAVAATALAGSAFAAASLSDVVQKGQAAAKVMEKNQINFATAKALGDHCLAEATAKGMGVSVVILDQFGTVQFTGASALMNGTTVTPATANTFSLLPSSNASGNFTKVIQLVPVRISVNLGNQPLLLGANVEVKIRVID